MKDTDLEKRALSGDAEAQYQMGKFYHNTNEYLAREWYNKAIEQNYEDAIVELALLNMDADTIDEFAENGNPRALHIIGMDCYNSYTIFADKNYLNDAFRWVSASAYLGYAKAQSDLGYLYLLNNERFYDRTSAYYWIRKAALQNVAAANFNLADLYSVGEYPVSVDVQKRYLLIQKAASINSDNFTFIKALADCFMDGRGTSKDYNKAYNAYRYAAQLIAPEKDEEVLSKIKVCRKELGLEKGLFGKLFGSSEDKTPIDMSFIDKSIKVEIENDVVFHKDANKDEYAKCLEKALQGDVDARFMMGQIYEKGIGVPVDKGEAVKWYLMNRDSNGCFTDIKSAENYCKLLMRAEFIIKNRYEIAADIYAQFAEESIISKFMLTTIMLNPNLKFGKKITKEEAENTFKELNNSDLDLLVNEGYLTNEKRNGYLNDGYIDHLLFNVFIINAQYVKDYIIELTFNDGVKAEVDIRKNISLDKDLAPINYLSTFKEFKLGGQNGQTLTWLDGKIEISPERLYEIASRE